MFGDHAGFIIPAYAISAVALIGMTVIIRVSYHNRRRELKALEDAGVSRRSAEKS